MFDVLAQTQPTIDLNPGGSMSKVGTLTVGSLISGAIQLILIVAALSFSFS